MTEQLTNKDEFNQWLVANEYLDQNGVLTIGMREARALWFFTQVQQDKIEIEKRFVYIAKNLWAIYKEAYWEPLGYNSFEQLLKSPEIDISVSVGYGLKSIGSYLEEGMFTEEKALEVGSSKLRAILPAIKENPSEAPELLDKATELTYLDLADEVAGRDIIYYKGRGRVLDLVDEMRREKPVLMESEVKMNVRTV